MDATKDCDQIKSIFEKHKTLTEEDPMMTNVHLQDCLTEAEMPAALKEGSSPDP